MRGFGRVDVDEKAKREIERGALHVYAQHVVEWDAQPGDWVEVVHGGETLGYGLFNPRSSIPVKIFSRTETTLEDYVAKRMEELLRLKRRWYKGSFRWVFAEGDRIPGLTVDVFEDVASVRITVLGLERAKETLRDVLEEVVDSAYVRETGELRARKYFLFGSKGESIIEEYGAHFYVDVVGGQKTGFYLDQRENRRELGRIVGSGDRVLDAFAYTGGFGIHAALAGADVTFVELGKKNARMIEKNLRLNGVRGRVIVGDALRFMERAGEFDVVVVDPPALAKGKDKAGALKMYMRINRAAMRLLGGGILVSCSCSHPVTPRDLLGVIRGAAEKEGKSVTLLGGVRGQAPDHTVYLPQPETMYLKCVFAVVE